MLGIERLHDRFACALAATGTAGDLREQLEGPLGCAEVREAEADIRRDHANQRHGREVMSLRDHLRADEDVELSRGKPREDARQRALAAD